MTPSAPTSPPARPEFGRSRRAAAWLPWLPWLLGGLTACSSLPSDPRPVPEPPPDRPPSAQPARQEEPPPPSTLERFVDDTRAIPGRIWGDLVHVVRRPTTWQVLLGATVALEIVLDSTGIPDELDREFVDRDRMDRTTSDLLALYGEGYFLLGLGSALYGYGLVTDEPVHYDAGRAALGSLMTTGIFTLGLKSIFRDERPNGASGGGYPSGHSAMSMAFATSLQESYGWRAGLPLFLITGAVAAQRLDSGAHEVEDVLFGLTLGYLMGRQVTRHQEPTLMGAQLSLGSDPIEGGIALSLHWSF